MAQVIKVNVGVLCRWMLDRLAEVDGLNSNTANYSRMDRNPRFSGDRDAILRIGRPRAVDGLMTAGFEVTPAVVRAFIVQLRYRWLGDVSDRNNDWLMQEPTEENPELFGQSVFEGRVIEKLCDYTNARPIDDEDNLLTIEPIRLVDGAEYADELHQIPPPDPTWGESKLVFAVMYMPTTGPLTLS